MTTVVTLQQAPAISANNQANGVSYVNGHGRHGSPEPSHRSTHSASSGEGLSMRDTGHNRSHIQAPVRSRTQIETNPAPALRRNLLTNGANGNSRGTRPRAQLQRANTDHGPRALPPSREDQVAAENWELRHGWEDEYNSNEILAKLSTVSAAIADVVLLELIRLYRLSTCTIPTSAMRPEANPRTKIIATLPSIGA